MYHVQLKAHPVYGVFATVEDLSIEVRAESAYELQQKLTIRVAEKLGVGIDSIKIQLGDRGGTIINTACEVDSKPIKSYSNRDIAEIDKFIHDFNDIVGDTDDDLEIIP